MNNTDKILQSIKNADALTSETINSLLDDPECMKLLKTLELAQMAMYNTSAPDVDKEWMEFAASHKCIKAPSSHGFSRKAATVAILVIGSTTIFAAIIAGIASLIAVPTDNTQNEAPTIVAGADSIDTFSIQHQPDNAIVVFDNKTLCDILNEIAAFYSLSVKFNSEASANMRLYFKWDQTLSAEEVIEDLNSFESIKIYFSNETIVVD